MTISKSSILKGIRRLRDEYTKLSARERALTLGAIGAIVFLIVWQGYEKVSDVFRLQNTAISIAEQDLAEVRERLTRYTLLQQRRSSIEEQFKEVEIKEGVRSHLESVLRTKANVSQGAYTIKDLPPIEFGGSYEQAPFAVKFTIGSVQGLIDFLKELAQGPKPLMLTGLEIKREPIGDKLRVSVDVSSIRRVK